jgi:hypothetical protein
MSELSTNTLGRMSACWGSRVAIGVGGKTGQNFYAMQQVIAVSLFFLAAQVAVRLRASAPLLGPMKEDADDSEMPVAALAPKQPLQSTSAASPVLQARAARESGPPSDQVEVNSELKFRRSNSKASEHAYNH